MSRLKLISVLTAVAGSITVMMYQLWDEKSPWTTGALFISPAVEHPNISPVSGWPESLSWDRPGTTCRSKVEAYYLLLYIFYTFSLPSNSHWQISAHNWMDSKQKHFLSEQWPTIGFDYAEQPLAAHTGHTTFCKGKINHILTERHKKGGSQHKPIRDPCLQPREAWGNKGRDSWKQHVCSRNHEDLDCSGRNAGLRLQDYTHQWPCKKHISCWKRSVCHFF